MMDCHIHYAIVTVRFCTDIFSRFFAVRNTRAGHDGHYWNYSIRKRLLRRRNNPLGKEMKNFYVLFTANSCTSKLCRRLIPVTFLQMTDVTLKKKLPVTSYNCFHF